jgi:hypothetical protein
MDLLQAQQLLAGDIGACDSSLFGNERYSENSSAWLNKVQG